MMLTKKGKMQTVWLVVVLSIALWTDANGMKVVRDGKCGENVTWSLVSGNLTIEGNGPVTCSTDNEWSDIKYSIKNVVIKDGVTSIGDNAFNFCTGLTTVVLPKTLKSIGKSAFFYCSGLRAIDFPEGLTSIGQSAFCSCDSLEKVVIPRSMTRIENMVFGMCSGLKELIIPDTVTSIGDSVFSSCLALTEVVIPGSLTDIGDSSVGSVFFQCKHLKKVTIQPGVKTIGNRAFEQCNDLVELSIPDTVTTIGDAAFKDCESLSEVMIPDSVTTIGESAFECTNLRSVTIPESVERIGKRAFFVRDSFYCSKRDGLTSAFYQGTRTISTQEVFNSDYIKLVCVPEDYKVTTFCQFDVTQSRTNPTCQEYNRMFNNCTKGAFRNGNVTTEKWKGTRDWERNSNGCMVYACDADVGNVSWSGCNSTEESTRVCLEGECREGTILPDKKIIVVVDLDDGLESGSMNATEIIRVLIDALETEIDDDLLVGWESDERGFVIRVYLYVDKKETAETIATGVDALPKGDECMTDNVFCKRKAVRILSSDKELSGAVMVHERLKRIFIVFNFVFVVGILNMALE